MSRSHPWRSLAGRLGLLLLLMLALQSALTGLALVHWLRSRDLALHKIELREQARLLLPALQDSLADWAGSGPELTRLAARRHHMRRSLGQPQAMSLVWVDPAGNMVAVGFLEHDPRLPELQELAAAGLGGDALEAWAGRSGLALVARPAPPGLLILAGDSSTHLWARGGGMVLVLILAASAAGAGATTWWLGRPLLRRLRRIEQAVAEVGAGDFSRRIHDRSPDELGGLAREVDRMAARLETLTRELASSDRRRRQLLSEVSHELGAPLTTLGGHLDLLQRAEDLSAEQRASLRLCSAQARKLDLLVADLLDLARLDDAGLRMRTQRLDLRDLVDQEVAAVELACLDRGVALEWRRPDRPLLVDGDGGRLAQVLRNLLRNAVHQLADPALESPLLQVELEERVDSIRLRVRDNGPGIRAEDLALLFDRYQRPHNSRGEGSGLGLCISRRLAELHGGTLEGHSPGLGRGAVFELSLPAAADAGG